MVASAQHDLPSHAPRSELDSLADNCCVGRNATLLYSHNQKVNMSPFLNSLGTANSVPIVTAAIAYDDETMAKTYILIVHQVLYFGDKLEHNLLNPFQCRLNGVNIKECPHLNPAVADDAHSMLFANKEVKIPLLLKGIVSYFTSRRRTKEAFEQYSHTELTLNEPEWNPHDGTYAHGESVMTGDNNNLLQWMAPQVQMREIMGLWMSKNMAKPDDPFLERIEKSVRISSLQSTV
jgi:hypothetical protein